MSYNLILVVIGVVSLFILEAFFEIALFSGIGAFVRWLACGRKKTLSSIYSTDTKTNVAIGIISFLLILAIPLGAFAIINN